MKLKVTDKGVLIPKELLGDSQEVEITQKDDQIIITKVNKSNMSIWDLGKNPVDYDISNHVDINDAENQFWLTVSQSSLQEIWEHPDEEVYNELL